VRAETQIFLTLDLICRQPQIVPIATIFYDAPTPPPGIFDDFLALPTSQNNLTSRSFSDLVSSLNFFDPTRDVSTRRFVTNRVFDSNTDVELTRSRKPSACFNEIPVTRYSRTVFDVFVNQINVSARLCGILGSSAR